MSHYLEIQLKNLRIQRGERLVLDKVTWTIRPGERWVLIGGNGAGKTQLLKLLGGDVWPAPDLGSRRYRLGKETSYQPLGVKDEIAYVGAERQDKHERYGWNFSVEDVVGTGLHRTDIPLVELSTADRREISKLLDKLNVHHLRHRKLLSLSYGERRLTLLARALAAKPKLLLLDELFNGLDVTNHERVSHWLKKTARSKMPWVLATHRAEDIPNSATHALIINAGSIIYRGPISRAPLSHWLGNSDKHPTKVSPPKQSHLRRRTVLVKLDRASIHLDGHAVVRDISWEIRAGECWVVHGANGSGKTTLLRAMYGDHAIEGGVKRFAIQPGVPLELFKKQVGWIAPHLQADFPLELTAAEVVQSGRYASIGLNDPPTQADRTAALRALEAFGLLALAGRQLRELSYGQHRRVLFARATVRKVRLLLLDEPFAGIDAPTRKALLDHLVTLQNQGIAIVIATHHRNEWPAGATHELSLSKGEITYSGSLKKHS